MPSFKVPHHSVFRFLLLSLGAAMLLPSTLLSAGANESIATDGSVEITISSWMEHLPRMGMAPMTVNIVNHRAVGGPWKFDVRGTTSSGTTVNNHFEVSVPPGASVSVPVLVNTGLDGAGSSGSSTVWWQAFGPGLNGMGTASFYHSGGSSSSSSMPYVALSTKFWDKNQKVWPTTLKTSLKSDPFRKRSVKIEEVSETVDMAEAPADWRGYSGLSHLWMLEEEWAAASEAQRQAMLAWAAAGGGLHVQLHEGSTELHVPGEPAFAAGKVVHHGLGRIEVIASGSTLSIEAGAMSGSFAASTERLLIGQVNDKHGLNDLVQPLPLRGGLVFGFIFCFGLLVGPANLFWFARGRHRPRLFWTTPVISMGGTAVLVAVMLLQDGLGGTGARTTLAVVLPRQKQMALVQDQYSRTGVLLGHHFDLPDHEAVWLAPATSSDGSSFPRNVTRGQEYDLNGIHAGGSWFTSRGTQGQVLHDVRLNRGGIEFQSSPQPSVVSSLGTPLKKLYVQSAGHFWVAENVATGQKTPLKPSSSDDFKKWMRADAQAHTGDLLRKRLEESFPATPAAPWFFAEATDPSRLAIPTLTSIRWDHDRAFVTGEWEGGK